MEKRDGRIILTQVGTRSLHCTADISEANNTYEDLFRRLMAEILLLVDHQLTDNSR